ncbi:hypothetical protein CDAR_103801 [Caerostris darwini]|uniref:Uncharacterized protein n=1 Tax=Caerostris darwini TaxID=1538125 RepID=A0AAV4NM94_9ARAC|nr:hypothetical protein CDAR_103801 [Caerostris darwini]
MYIEYYETVAKQKDLKTQFSKSCDTNPHWQKSFNSSRLIPKTAPSERRFRHLKLPENIPLPGELFTPKQFHSPKLLVLIPTHPK